MFDAVTAVVYFTLKEKQYIQQDVTTHSVLTENTVMVFQLESYEIPEKFQKEDFLVQVALQVGTKEGSVVPSNLEEARTASKELREGASMCHMYMYVFTFVIRMKSIIYVTFLTIPCLYTHY